MQEKADAKIKWHPGKVEKGREAAAGQEAAHLVEVAQRPQPIAASPRPQREPQHGVERARADRVVQGGADPHQDPTANEVEQPHGDVEHRRDDGEPDQRRHASARQHPIVDLQHEDRAGQHEQVDEPAH